MKRLYWKLLLKGTKLIIKIGFWNLETLNWLLARDNISTTKRVKYLTDQVKQLINIQKTLKLQSDIEKRLGGA